MSSKSKSKGNRFEREIVNEAREKGLKAERAYASNGRALGEHETVDVMIAGWKAQCKIRKRIGQLFKPSEYVDIQIVREDHGQAYVILPYEKFLNLLKGVSNEEIKNNTL